MNNSNKRISKYIPLFNRTDINKIILISDILSKLTYDEIVLLKKKVPKLFHGLFKVKYLRRCSYSEVASSGSYIQKGDDIIEYFGTLAYIFEQHKDILNLFVGLLSQFEKHFLLGDFNKCLDILHEINDRVSYSYWGADIEIKLSRLITGLPGATTKHNEIFAENNRFSFLYNFSLKTSAIDTPFDSEVEHILKRIDNQETKEFVIFHSFPFIDNKEGSWIYSNSTFSIIDLYCGFIYSLDCLSDETINNKKFLRFFNIISSTIDDYRLKKRCCLYNKKFDDIKNEKERQEIISDYLWNNYEGVVIKGECYIVEKPFDISIIDLYVKSCILTGKEITGADTDSSIIQKIIYYYYRYLLNNNESEIFEKKLINICKVWYNIPSIKHLYLMIEDRSSNDITQLSKNYWRSSLGFNIQDVCFYSDISDRQAFVSSLDYKLGLKYESYYKNADLVDNVDFFDFQLCETNKISGFIYELDKSIEEKTIPSFYRNSICSYVFNQHLLLKHINDAISLFAREMTCEESLHLTVLDNRLIQEIVDSDIDKQFSNSLDFAIFYTYVNAAPYKRYLSLKRFLKQNNVNKVSELLIDGSKKLKFLLENVADRQVLALHRLHKNSNDVIDERIMICKNLFDYYKDKSYLEEISSLSKEQTINGLVQEVDNSKIYVDTDNIKNKELKDKEFNVLFDIFKNTDAKIKYLEEKIPKLREVVSLLQSQGLSFTLFSSNNAMEIDYKQSLFKTLYLNVRDKFVYDPKYGLDYYLSTRIRHGTIDNQLRNHLQEFQLVTNTDDSGNYIRNEYWYYRLGNSKKCMDILNDFSRSADKIIFDLKSERIQIKTEDDTKKTEAVFDFSSDKLTDYIDSIFIDCSKSDFDNCVLLIFEKLWEYTEVCLSKMRDVLSETQETMRKLLEQLYSDITKLLGHNNSFLNEFKTAIISCQTSLQSDFNKVQSWFQRKDISTFDFSIQQAFDASLSAINRINQDGLTVNKTINSTSSFHGKYFGAMHDLFHDILNNVLDYEKKQKRKLGTADVKIEESDHILNILVVNPIAKEDVANLESIIDELEGRYSSLISKGRSRSEGKSGFTKIYNIVTNVFESPDNKYTNRIENDLFKVEISINISKLIK